MDKKLKGAILALVGSLCYGGAQLLGLESRVAKLEELAGVEVEEVAEDEAVEEVESTEEPDESPEEE